MTDWIRYDYGSASILEICWTLIGVVGFVYTYGCLTECRRDLDALITMVDFKNKGPRHIIAQANQRQYTFRLMMFVFILILGVFAMFQSRGDIAHPPTVYSVVLGVGFLLFESLMSLGSYLDTKDRRLVMQQIAQEQQQATRASVRGGRRHADYEGEHS